MTTMKTRAAKGSELTHGELDANFDRDVDVKTTTYAALVSDNRTTLECNHAATPFTVTLGDAATMAAADTGDYEITIANIGAAAVTVARAGSDTIDGAATSIVLAQYSSVTLKVNAATDGYNSIAGRRGITASDAELNYSDGVTSNIQTQIDSKVTSATMPNFSAGMATSNQTITTSTATKVRFDSEEWDTNTDYDPTTNYRFTPTVAGKYSIAANVFYSSGTTGPIIYIYKNGAQERAAYSGHNQDIGIAALIEMNGSTDYVEIYIWHTTGSDRSITYNIDNTRFQGNWVGP